MSAPSSSPPSDPGTPTPGNYIPSGATLFGHPTGLYALFFAEMWERFSYYGMRALLVLYMVKGFAGYGDSDAYRVYGAYTALVYMTPFIGGMIADRLLGARRAVVLGGLLMAAGHLLMTWEAEFPFFMALALLIVGNGFFKPNISTIVGSLYPPGSPQRDGGFTIFYIGINLGAMLAPLLCGYVGETYGWHYGFGLATIGMLVGLAVFVVPSIVARVLILVTALTTAFTMMGLHLQDHTALLTVNGIGALALVVSGIVSFVALGRAGLPQGAGAPPDPSLLRRPVFGGIPAEWMVYGGSLLVVPIGAGLVWSNRVVTLIPESVLKSLSESGSALGSLAATLLGEISTPTGLTLFITGVVALSYIGWSAWQSTKVEAQRLAVVVVLMFFSMLFWAFFEQAGSSINLFTDRNVDRVFVERVVTNDMVGTTVDIELSQAQLGYHNGTELFTLDRLDAAREAKASLAPWEIDSEDVGMVIASNEVPASTFQAANPLFILMFGLLFSGLWVFLGKRGLEPNTPIKFGLGLLQLGLGFVALWYGATTADARGMVGVHWLLLGYLLHTTGELCLSPVGLSMVTKLSPARLVSTVMGAWFLATAFSSYLSSVIAVFTGVGEGGAEGAIPAPIETVHLYGSVFGTIGIAAALSSLVIFALSPLLAKWMHGVK
jgi:proton-dependent oligopeptide transporter, POT family